MYFLEHTQSKTNTLWSHSIRPVIVVPHKWVKGSKLHPSHTQLFSRVASKATDVCPDQRHTEQAELQHSWKQAGGNSSAEIPFIQ